MAILHYSSPHWEKGRLFTSEEDFVFGVNTLALAVALFNVKLLCYCLMDNHIHILLEGEAKECEKCYMWIMLRIAQMAGRRGCQQDRLDMLDIRSVPVTGKKQFVNELAYILRNPYKARINSPLSYKWSSWDVYFNPRLEDEQGEPIINIPVSKARELFRTKQKLPQNYQHIAGRILNKCFVDYKRAEQLIESDLDLFDTLRLWDLESSVAISHGAEEKIKYTDAELASKIKFICKNEYHADSPEQLDRKTLLLLARIASRRFGASKKQLLRLLDVSPEALDAVL